MRINPTEHWYFSVDEEKRFHWENWEPAIVENSYEEEVVVWEEIMINKIDWYKAWYTHWVIERVERDNGDVFTYTNGELDDTCSN